MAPDFFQSMTVGDALRAGGRVLASARTPMLDSRILLKHAAGLDDVDLIVGDANLLTQEQARAFCDCIARRNMGEPVAYIIGVKEFWSLEFDVTPDVLIPREDSECLIEAATARRADNEQLSILDLGTGSGCLLCALLYEFDEGEGVGVDRSEKALAIASANAQKLRLGERATFLVSNWFSDVAGPFDLIIANPPYIPDRDREGLPVDVAGFEPDDALFAGVEGLDAYAEILVRAPSMLAKDGLMIFEMGVAQAGQLMEMVTNSFPEAEIGLISDLQQRSRGIFADRRRGIKKD